jgi:hypothetical protein
LEELEMRLDQEVGAAYWVFNSHANMAFNLDILGNGELEEVLTTE